MIFTPIWFVILRLLRAKYRDGTYLIREGTHAGTEKVLSVWHIDRCRHYKLFKDEVNDSCVSEGGTTVLTGAYERLISSYS